MNLAYWSSGVGLSLFMISACDHSSDAAVGSGGGNAEDPVFPFQTPFDFTDSFYIQNGLDPAGFAKRLTPESPAATFGVSQDPTRNNTRILAVLGGYDAAGALLYYPAPPAPLLRTAFIKNDAGDRALDLANEYRAFLFPQRDLGVISSAAGDRRQGNVFDTSSGYFSENPLGLWRLTFPRFTDEALNTADGLAALQVLSERNGFDKDGTPILKRLSEINELEAQGYLDLIQRKADGSEGPPWVV